MNLKLERHGEVYDIILKKSTYVDGKSLAIAMEYYDEEYKAYMPFAILTTNIWKKPESNCAFVDTNNLGEEIIDWIVKNGLGKPTGRTAPSGYCEYPEVRFDLDKIENLTRINEEGGDK